MRQMSPPSLHVSEFGISMPKGELLRFQQSLDAVVVLSSRPKLVINDAVCKAKRG